MKLWTLPNILTIMRIILIPVFVIFFYVPFSGHEWVSMGVFILAAVTDWLDGFLARHLKLISRFGAFLDPVADKLMVCTALLLCASKFATPWFAIPAIIIVCREIIISALREWMAEVGQRTKIGVNIIGKFKTFIQIVAICFFISQPTNFSIMLLIGYILLYAAVILTIWSMFVYSCASIKYFREQS